MIGNIPSLTVNYKITLTNKESESCVITATKASSGNTETVTLAPDESVTLSKKIPANKTIGDYYTSIIADFNGETLELDTTTVVTQDIEVELELPAPDLTPEEPGQ